MSMAIVISSLSEEEEKEFYEHTTKEGIIKGVLIGNLIREYMKKQR